MQSTNISAELERPRTMRQDDVPVPDKQLIVCLAAVPAVAESPR
jgi:hypothetical protein